MSRVKRNELERVGKALSDFGAFLLENAGDISTRANRDADDGVRGVSYGGSRSPSGHSDPVAVRVERDRWDPIRKAEDRFVTLLRNLTVETQTAERQARGFLAITQKQAEALLKGGEIAGTEGEEDRFGHVCANPACKTDVAGTPNDRLKAGRCVACYMYRLRHGGSVERPRHLCQPEPEAEAV